MCPFALLLLCSSERFQIVIMWYEFLLRFYFFHDMMVTHGDLSHHGWSWGNCSAHEIFGTEGG